MIRIEDHNGMKRIYDGDSFVGVVSNHGTDRGFVWKVFREGSAKTMEEAVDAAKAASWQFIDYIERQWSWSRRTFGPGRRTKGIVDHIQKELREVLAEPEDLKEWADLVTLSLDGFWRHGGSPQGLIEILEQTQVKNFSRTWPDWRGKSEDVAIEHDRSKD